jgi:hypothetical protein
MLRKVASKVAWVGRTASMVFGLALVLALLFGVASMAFADNGQPFLLGRLTNTATAITKLTGNVTGGPALQVANPNTATGSKGLQVNVTEGKTPIQVNPTAGKATNLNADKLDGKDFGAFNAVELFDHRSGPLPLESTFTSEGGTLIFFASGTGFRDSDNTRFAGAIAMNLVIDTGSVIYTEQQSITINEQDHREPVVSEANVFAGLPAGEHTVRLTPAYGSDCNTDSERFTTYCTSTSTNDRFSVTVLEIPD